MKVNGGVGAGTEGNTKRPNREQNFEPVTVFSSLTIRLLHYSSCYTDCIITFFCEPFPEYDHWHRIPFRSSSRSKRFREWQALLLSCPSSVTPPRRPKLSHTLFWFFECMRREGRHVSSLPWPTQSQCTGGQGEMYQTSGLICDEQSKQSAGCFPDYERALFDYKMATGLLVSAICRKKQTQK